MITIKGSIAFILKQQKRFPSHTIKRLVRKNKEWYLTLEAKEVEL